MTAAHDAPTPHGLREGAADLPDHPGSNGDYYRARRSTISPQYHTMATAIRTISAAITASVMPYPRRMARILTGVLRHWSSSA